MREGLMDDTGYHGFDYADEFFEKYCCRCNHIKDDGDCEIHDCFTCNGEDYQELIAEIRN